MLIIAHRGYHAKTPENTLASFEAAIALGVDGIETDIRLSADGLLILYHDRLAPNGRPVRDVTQRELEKLAGHAIPTLDQALELFPQPLWILEIKAPEALGQTLKLIRRLKSSRRLMVISFWHNVILTVSEEIDVECGLLICHCPAVEPPTLLELFTALVWNFEFMDAESLGEAKAQVRRNFVYGAVTKDEHEACKRLGLDGVITDHPELLL
jgi:glycerophosphoryl diester phosphodiesterase